MNAAFVDGYAAAVSLLTHLTIYCTINESELLCVAVGVLQPLEPRFPVHYSPRTRLWLPLGSGLVLVLPGADSNGQQVMRMQPVHIRMWCVVGARQRQ